MSTEDGLSRSAFYGFTYVPFATLNGKGSSASSIKSSNINTEFNKDNYFDFKIKSVMTNSSPHTCSTAVTVTSLTNYSSNNVVLMAAIIEKDVDYFQTYKEVAKNGKNDYSHVLRSYLSATSGEILESTSEGSVETFTFTYTNNETYQNYENLRIIVYAQDRSSKEVLGAYQMEDHPFQELTLSSQKFPTDDPIITISRDCTLTYYSPNSGLLSMKLFSLNGKCLLSYNKKIKEGINKISLDNRSLKKGMYLLTINGVKSKNVKLILP